MPDPMFALPWAIVVLLILFVVAMVYGKSNHLPPAH